MEAAQEAVWMKEFITALGVIPKVSGPMTLFCDNTGAIALAMEPRFHKKTRHIKRRFNSIRENVQDGDIDICKGHRRGSGGPPGGATYPGGPHGL